MKLNESQIKIIDSILEKLGVVYIDYKFEILDHIATEVEQLMEETNEDFEKSLVVILEKWEPKLNKSGAWFGIMWEMPEILCQKAKKLYWKKVRFLVISSLVLALAIYLSHNSIPKFFDGIWGLLIVNLLVQFILYIKIRRSIKKTTYGFLFKQQFMEFLFLNLQQLFSLHTYDRIFENANWAVLFIYFLISILILAPITSYKFYSQHFEQLERNKSVFI